MSVVDFLTEEEIQLYRSYRRKQHEGLLSEVTEEERNAVAKYKRFSDSLNPIRSRFTYAKKNAVSRGIEFTITLEDFIRLCEKTKICPILNIELDYSLRTEGKGQGKARPNAASLDRIDSNKGYTLDNIQIISWKANCMKNMDTEEQLARDILAAVSWAKRKLGEWDDTTENFRKPLRAKV